MGSFTSSQNPRVPANAITIKKVANEPAEKRQNYSPESKLIEDASINALKKMEAMEEAITKKYNLTTENFEAVWDDFMKKYGYLMRASDVQTFDEEREKITAAFADASFESKEEALSAYETAVKEQLQKITDKTIREIKEENAKKDAKTGKK